MAIDSHLKKQAEIARWINDHLARPFSVDRKRQLALACFDLAIEYHAGIHLLCTSELYGPMYALLRVEFEALGRGLWLSHVATDEDADKYEKDKLDIGFGTVLNLVESQVGLPNGPLSTLKSKHWSIFCSFTHTGYQALVRRVTQTHTGPVNYPAEEIISALNLAGTFALLAAAQLSSMAGDHDLVDTTLAKVREYAS
jgi:hypothetical protein